MGLNVRFESPAGTPHPALRFDTGEEIRVTGGVWNVFGLPSPNMRVDLTLYDQFFAPMTWQTGSNIWGNYWFDITLPNVATNAFVRVDAYFVGSIETAVVEIGIGVQPPVPKPPRGILDQLWSLAVIGVVVVGGVMVYTTLRKK